MKVVLFCGGMGTRLRDDSQAVPKPMVRIGQRPILWHVMKYYAHFGHTEFILCLGYRSESIKEYFLSYDETVSNDFVFSEGGRGVRLLNTDIDDWKVTFVDTGVNSTIGKRLKAVESHLADDPVFLANYSDGLTDLHLPDYLDFFARRSKVASFLAVKPTQSFHVASIGEEGSVDAIHPLSDTNVWINGGFFIFRREIFAHLRPGEDLVDGPFDRLIRADQLIAFRYSGFWAAMDTFKDRMALESRIEMGEAPWELWKSGGAAGPTRLAGRWRFFGCY